LVALQTDGGMIRVPSRVATNDRAAIQFVGEKNAKGELALSVPEDLSLYFLSGQEYPTGIFPFSPGVVAPEKMTREVMDQVESKKVRHLIWSNRTYRDYGTTVFGLDYDQTLGNYLKTHGRGSRITRPEFRAGLGNQIYPLGTQRRYAQGASCRFCIAITLLLSKPPVLL
jgi:hypothetical protein